MAQGGGDDSQEKTEDPTDKRREESREKGQVAQSKEASTVMVFLAAVGVFVMFHESIVDVLSQCMIHYLQFGGHMEMNIRDVQSVLRQAAGFMFRIVTPLFIAVFVVGIAANVGQFGFLYAPSKIEIKPEKINPLAGVKRMFSLRQIVEGVKNVLKVGLIGTIVYFVFSRELGHIESMIDMSPRAMLTHIIWAVLKMTWKVSLFLVALAVFDFAYQRWEHTRSMRMSRQEIKDEMKESQGDPMIKQRVRQIQADQARNRMMKDVKGADVVVTNPTHLAVALKYDRMTMSAPRVVAKGAGYLAKRIRELAKENGIPLVENKPVAQILYKTVKIGAETPVSLYKAIAGIMAYVYKTAKKKPSWV